MEVLGHIGWILLYIFVISFIPAIVVLLASFLTGLGFLIRDVKYDIEKALNKRKEPEEQGVGIVDSKEREDYRPRRQDSSRDSE